MFLRVEVKEVNAILILIDSQGSAESKGLWGRKSKPIG